MSETEFSENIDPETGEVLEPEQSSSGEPDIPFEEPEPDEDTATADAATEREADLAAERQAEAQEEQVSEAQIEKNTKALNRAAKAYIDKAVATLGPDLAGMQTCPLCADGWPGLRFPNMPPPENLAAVRVAIGLEPGDSLPKDNYSRTCDACEGWGFTDSGSKVPGQQKLTCYDCKGKGWKPVGNEREDGSITAGNGHAAPLTAPLQDNPSNDPPEVARLKGLGYVVVAPIAPVEVPQV